MADRANIGIVTQQPRGDEEPLVLTKVLHSKKYVEYARARSTKTVGREDSDEEDSDSQSDAPRESRKTKVGKSIAVRRERVQEGESSDEEDSDSEPSDSEPDAPCESRKTKVGRSIAVRRERVQEGQKKKTVAPRRDAEHDSDSAPVEPTRKKKTVAPRRDADHDSDSVPAEPAKKKKTLAPRRDAEHDSDSAPAEPTKKKKTLAPRRDMEVDSDSVPTRLPKKIAGKGRDEVGLVRKAHVETQETDENEERPRKRARLNREHGKKHGKEKNIADQSEVVGGQGRKRKRDEDAPRVIAQLSRPIVKLPKRKSGD